jgi:DNA-directed RNA polymerase subunit alpha
VRRVKYEVQDKRMGQRTDYDRLVLEIETNGVIAPVQAVAQAAALLSRYFGSVASALSVREESPAVREGEDASGPEVASDVPAFPIIPGVEQSVLARPVRDLELSVRSENCLLRGGVHLIGDLVGRSKDDLLKIRNLGKISLREIEEKLVNFGLALGGGSSSEGEEPEDGEGEGSEPSEEPRLSLVPQETEEVADLDDVTPSDPEPDSPAQPGALEAEAKEE